MSLKSKTIASIKNKIQSINNFNENGFDENKSKLFSELSRLSYLAIPEYEFESRGRFKLMPCDIYYNIPSEDVLTEKHLNDEFEKENSFIIKTKSTIIVGFEQNKILFISVRGTSSLYNSTYFHDICINTSYKLQYIGNGAYIHKGYLEATLESIQQLRDKIDKIRDVSEIYITGHSLGGAVATILFNILSGNIPNFSTHFYYHERLSSRPIFTKMNSCYTFGIPRYGNIITTIRLQPSYHTFHKNDIVTKIPQRSAGYADNLDNREKNLRKFSEKFSKHKGFWGNIKTLLHNLNAVRYIYHYHSIDNYCDFS